MIFTANLLTGAKHHPAFSTNHLTDIDKTKHNYNQRQHKKQTGDMTITKTTLPSRVEWRGETDNRAAMPVGYCPSTASFSVRPQCENARRDRCQEYHNCFPFRGLEETTRTSSCYMDEDYPARPEIKQSLPGWGDNCGSESSTLETDVCVWRYAPLSGACQLPHKKQKTITLA